MQCPLNQGLANINNEFTGILMILRNYSVYCICCLKEVLNVVNHLFRHAFVVEIDQLLACLQQSVNICNLLARL